MSTKRKKPGNQPARREERVVTGVADVMALYDAITQVIRPVMDKHGWAINNCIGASMIGQAVLRHYGISSELVPVGVLTGNAAGKKVIEEAVASGKKPVWDGDEAWTVGIVPTGELTPTGWDGHMVIQTGHNVLLDLSADQLSRPEKNLVIYPLAIPLAGPGMAEHILRDWNTEGKLVVFEDDGSFLQYTKIFGHAAQNYKRSKDWQRGVQAGAVLDVIQRVNARLELQAPEDRVEQIAQFNQMSEAGPTMEFVVERELDDGKTFSADALQGLGENMQMYVTAQVMAHWKQTKQPAKKMRVTVTVETAS